MAYQDPYVGRVSSLGISVGRQWTVHLCGDATGVWELPVWLTLDFSHIPLAFKNQGNLTNSCIYVYVFIYVYGETQQQKVFLKLTQNCLLSSENPEDLKRQSQGLWPPNRQRTFLERKERGAVCSMAVGEV